MLRFKTPRLIIAAIALSTMPVLQGCAALTAITGVSSAIDALDRPIVVSATLKEHYLRLITAAYGANALAEVAVDNGLLKPGSERAVWVADRLKDLDAVVTAARTAYHAKDAVTLKEKIEAGNRIVDALSPIINR